MTVYTPRHFRHWEITVSLCDGSARSLVCLKVVGSHLAVAQIEKIQETCRAMKRLSIMGNNDAVSRLIVSDGCQLEWACLPGFTEGKIRDVPSACTNARFHAYVGSRDVLLPTLNLLAIEGTKVAI